MAEPNLCGMSYWNLEGLPADHELVRAVLEGPDDAPEIMRRYPDRHLGSDRR